MEIFEIVLRFCSTDDRYAALQFTRPEPIIQCNEIYSISGEIVVFETYDAGLTKIDDIKKWFEDPFTKARYKLAGIVEYVKAPRATGGLGHYKAICLRNANWIIYDDLHPDEAKQIKNSYVCDVSLVVYVLRK